MKYLSPDKMHSVLIDYAAGKISLAEASDRISLLGAPEKKRICWGCGQISACNETPLGPVCCLACADALLAPNK